MQPDLAALVGSRICHDLISPIGAIGNGVELLALTDGDTGAEMELINESVQNASARIRYFRIAYGAASEEQLVSRSEVLSILSAVARGGRINYIWKIGGDQPRRLVRCALLMLQAIEAALPMGGDVQITQDGDTWVMRGEGPRLSVDEELWQNLLSPQVGFHYTAAHVQFALLPSVLAEAGRVLQFKHGTDHLVARF
ncbi:histidine phosphotransferase family protein [Yoonia sp. F2084L]|uniref:histidine phosphotransferase family protein n=1 Tax=Yoonia sp. F2084L TaxID=2926419 RepID=UPI001FF2473E|nr:histidine phosphotransferase family protein [Yoonia sp. F2084L]MCK0094563.1 histidine phosphotransferase family protein [Yoonia sp. F2084L]